MNFNPFPVLTSEYLILRKVEESDNYTILHLRSDKIINQYIKRPEHRQTKSITDALNFIKTQHKNLENNVSIVWGITLKDQSELIGTICLWNFSENKKVAEVGYDLKTEFHNKGIMTEALNLVLNFGFKQLKLQKIEAFTHFKNESSKRLLTKNGFILNPIRKDLDNDFNLIYENFKDTLNSEL
ncbi:GNAT family N-acetyltransferase [Winogradskyella endarachnes]|uniref:GNAT family N-acetyltransferase n=1 Tax=Winogradskyella endarachnes TaxID=2681965 RepID=A0A6L6UDW6_9FLAO|nr:GNAT family N-acetyltransferase [Winogradskyella endarachnes]MUU79716.1 GNAT family N-acetyltransferase [Winogradskyella endarachnes]